jgi:hypothetical protein
MNKLFDILLANPRAALEAGVFIPCSLLSALDLEDDQAIPRNEGISRSSRAVDGVQLRAA